MKSGEFIMAFVMASAIAFAAHVVADRQRNAVPVSAWLQSDEFYVSDTIPGARAAVSARFLVFSESETFWVSEVQKLNDNDGWASVCSYTGQDDLIPAFAKELTWDDLVEPSCVLTPGQYRLRVTFVLARPGWEPKRLPVTSNNFEVKAQDG